MKVFVVMSHELLTEQITELKNQLNCHEIIYLPEQLKDIWANIPPSGPWNDKWLADIISWLKSNMNREDIAIVQGEYGATVYLVNWLQKNGHAVYYATTERQVVETKTDEGSIINKRVFKHVNFRKYPLVK
ncbi:MULTISPECIES: CRISPR-associated protein Csx20 [Bacillaceae]|uniref:CRISPR-associated protein Csx20 n=1 Tax=Bacillaceae TaxID=186817 RepID=UPI000D5611BF|nr:MULTISPECIES: CRISPR-associated protein Csx20 [Bacillaceae]AWI13445.1 hypothetical protein CQJ30_15580 [Caldibacillus thermoamylovorans]MCB5936077.1 CRISPR-associated protein Csx20 [Bacillus sp. DFI.2.34]MCB7077426.1 CRISPR-associated protein Csx20 [Caldibacillus thermoamylovorans]